ncbi:intein/RHS repeat-associated protein [Micromonospora pisi]|uniref:Intein/RHS repeat-associated protein n=1 Tax=Micromonospora pisi TaxID=589240 RepID=A0A495JI54_9ACTN|nr:intein/RHS repeat-associated protein [Micromonospora pisi]
MTRTGFAEDGTTGLAEPAVQFGGTRKYNRVDWGNDIGVAPYARYRIGVIKNGVGGETLVTYSGEECTRAVQPSPHANPWRCFPQMHKPVGMPAGYGWFHKYVVTQVVEHDTTGGSPDQVTSYSYGIDGSTDTALWAHDHNETSLAAVRTWSLWRGYTTVTTTEGAAGGPQTSSRKHYFRGMSGDGMPSADNESMVWNSRRVGITTPMGTPGMQVAVSGQGGRCLEAAGNATANGSVIQMWDCTGATGQVWQTDYPSLTDPSFRLRNPQSGRCLDIANQATGNGSEVTLWDCNTGGNQRWVRQPNGSLRNPPTGRCLDIVSASTSRAARLQIWDCTNAWSQIWQPQANGTLISPQSNRCLEVSGTTDGTRADSRLCNDGSGQGWETRANGGLLNPRSGKCLDVINGGTANGTLVQLLTCNGGGSQVWQPQPNGTLLNPQSGRCLAGGQAPNGTQAGIWDCTAALSQLWANRVSDVNGLEGRPREEITLDGTTVIGGTIRVLTAVQTGLRPTPVAGGEDVKAHMVLEGSAWQRTWLPASGTWRWTYKRTTFDEYGLPTTVTNAGDLNTAADNLCTRYTYVRNTTRGIVDTVSRTLTTLKDCSATPTYPQDLVSDDVASYDGQAAGVAPTQGLVTRTEQVKSHNGTTSSYVTSTSTTYDSYGRPLTVTDALNNTTRTSYTPPTGAAPSTVTVTNPAGHITTTHYDPRKGLILSVVDANNKTTTAQYDLLGRRTKVWNPGRATNQTPDAEYIYTVNATARHVQTKTLAPNGNQVSSFAIYDGLLQARQTQSTTPSGTRAVSDTQYDSQGLPVKTSTFHNAAASNGTLYAFNDADVATQSRRTYDGAGRPKVDAFWSRNTFKWQTTTTYGGDRIHVDPPDGGVATTTIHDARGNTTALRQYHTGSISGGADETIYQYDPSDMLTKVIDPAGNEWSYTYDLRGRQISKNDPDAGESSSTYDDLDRVLTTTDARGETIARVYNDSLGRLTETRDDSPTGALRTSYVYDTLAKGQLTSSTRHIGAAAYTTAVTGYTDRYQPTGSTVTIPATEGNLAGIYTTAATFLPTGAPATTTLPALGGLPEETLTYGYGTTGLATTMASPITTYVASTSHDWLGGIENQILGAAGKRVRLGYGIDEATRRLTNILVDTENPTTPNTWNNRSASEYEFDPAGNITTIAGKSDGVRDQVECFRYDYHRRLTDAWSQPATGCTTPQRAGADPYRLAWTYDVTGNRKTQTSWSATGTTTATSTYPNPKADQPHTLTQVAYTGETTRTDTYTYDLAGNTITRPVNGATQTLTWDPEGHLASTSQTGLETSYVYDASGNRLLRRDTGGGGSTLYLGGTELHLKTNGQVDGTRYYTHNGTTVAVRGVTGLTWVSADHHGTSQVKIDPDSLDVIRRRSTPFGEPRGTQPTTWPSQKGFVGGTQDPTGLTHLGAREYDPTTGRFISVDPVIDTADPQQINGYAYSYNSPVTFTDPDGLRPLITETADGDERHYRATGEKVVKKSNGKWGVRKDPVKPAKKPTNNGPSKEDLAKANKIKNTSIKEVILKAAGDLLLDFLGINDILGCVGGNLVACGMALLNVLPPGKVANAFLKGKALLNRLKAVESAVRAWDKSVAWANKILGKCHSFAPGTKVVLANGQVKAIEEFDEGDQVLATNPATGETEARKVTDTHTNLDSDLADLTIRFADGRIEVIETTQHHPFWSQTRYAWIDAVNLQPGERLLALDKTPATVTTTRYYAGSEVMHDLTVDTDHTYYVVAGTTPVLVHNCIGTAVNKSTGLSSGELEGAAIQARDSLATHLSRSVSGRKMPNVAIGGYNMQTGEYAAAASSAAGCAETCLINALGGDPTKVMRTTPVLLRKSNFLSPRAVCISCELTWGRENVSPETTFASDWLRVNDPD